jgi:hypothetical protein
MALLSNLREATAFIGLIVYVVIASLFRVTRKVEGDRIVTDDPAPAENSPANKKIQIYGENATPAVHLSRSAATGPVLMTHSLESD